MPLAGYAQRRNTKRRRLAEAFPTVTTIALSLPAYSCFQRDGFGFRQPSALDGLQCYCPRGRLVALEDPSPDRPVGDLIPIGEEGVDLDQVLDTPAGALQHREDVRPRRDGVTTSSTGEIVRSDCVAVGQSRPITGRSELCPAFRPIPITGAVSRS